MAKELAVVLNNGSVNSAVVTALAGQRFRLAMLHVIFGGDEKDGSESATRTRVAFDQQTAHFKPYREHVLELPFLSQLQAPGGLKKNVDSPEPRQQTRTSSQLLDLVPVFG